MRRMAFLKGAAGLALLLWLGANTAPARAQSSEDDVNWATCSLTAGGGAGTMTALFVFEPFPVAKGNDISRIDMLFEKEVGAGTVIPGYSNRIFFNLSDKWNRCSTYSTKGDALSEFNKRKSNSYFKIHRTLSWRPSDEVTGLAKGPSVKKNADINQLKDSGKEEPAKPDATEEAAKRRDQREAEFQAELAAHEASVAEYRRKAAEREAEIARQQQEHAAAQEAAAREKAEHARLLEEHMKRQMDYEAARNRHTLCVNGNKKACAEIEAGKPVTGEKLADAGDASTDTDANRCVTTVETKLNATFKGNTSASVINGCGKPVDVRICLMTRKGWNCGDDSAVASQAKATHSSFNATGEVFVDARFTDSIRAFNKPR